MQVNSTTIPGVLYLVPRVFSDHRGYFYESYHSQRFSDAGIQDEFVQDNQSLSQKGVIRGLHYQIEPYAQSKLIRVIDGLIRDVVVDLRKGSPTFGHWEAFELSGEKHQQLYVPRGLAHGFEVLSKDAVVLYKTDAYYNPSSERGIRYNDPMLKIEWKTQDEKALVSPKDIELPLFDDAEFNFTFNDVK